MERLDLVLAGARLTALQSGALWWEEARLLCVSDLHLGKSERLARRGGSLLPPYEVQETLSRLEADIAATDARSLVCLGDSFDDTAAAEALPETALAWLTRLQAGREWFWIAGNHDPAPLTLSGTHLAELRIGHIVFRHIAVPGAEGEISGHYHPKARLNLGGQRIARPCFLMDRHRLILPAYGTYTGGLWCDSAPLSELFDADARAILLGRRLHMVPMPGQRLRR
ncbi:ligase-associated DNA damage response endonuclease PdeM [Plastorhodobacter daqingensis]|uniref:Ligase-associated DNA damage response endonuclease PdeM n=1 Tax=Plastorhodobacter daqingensis TaxID=1387281 RepID=A0ABW2UNG7_9RHOB